MTNETYFRAAFFVDKIIDFPILSTFCRQKFFLSTKNKNGQQKFCRQKNKIVNENFVDKKLNLSTKNFSKKKKKFRQKFCRQKNLIVDINFVDKKK